MGGHLSYVVRGGLWLFLERGIVLVISLCVSVAFANFVPKDVYGSYKYILALGTFLTIFSLTGLDGNIIRAAAKGHEGTFLESIRMYFRWCWGIVITGILLALYYALQDNTHISASLLIIAFTTPFIQGLNMYRSYLYGKQLFGYVSKLNVLYTFIPNAGLVIAMFFTHSLEILIGVFFILSVCVLVAQFFLVLKKYPPNTSRDPHTWQMGKHMSIMNVFALLTGKIDSILLFQFAGSTQLAVYSFAIAIPEMIRGSFKTIQTLAIPKIIKSTSTNLRHSLFLKSLLLLCFTSASALVYVFLAPILFSILFPQYPEAIPYSQVFAVTIILNSLFTASFFESRVAIKQRYALNVFANGATILTLVPLVYMYGIWGAVWARIISRLLNACFSMFLFYRYKDKHEDR